MEIPEFPGYTVDRDGNVYNKTGHKLGFIYEPIDKGGYAIVRLFKDKKRFHKKVHRLIGELFIPNPDNLPTIDHINRNVLDNRVDNLRWANWSDQHFNKNYRKKESCGITITPSNTYCARIGYERKMYRKNFIKEEEAKQWLIDMKTSLGIDTLYNN